MHWCTTVLAGYAMQAQHWSADGGAIRHHSRLENTSGDRSRPAEPDVEQVAIERGRQWHSWHLSRLELPAWQRPMTSEPAKHRGPGHQ